MSRQEGFLARWSRLKREQADAGSSPVNDAPSAARVSSSADVAAPVVDLASLPPIESLGPGSDVSAYLAAGVPPELTRAALRSAWRNDPAVREFIEIADNQWDFNMAEAMPGFGPLGTADEARNLVAQALSTVDKTTATLASLQPQGGAPSGQVKVGMPPLEDSRVVDPVWQAGGAASLTGVEQTPLEAPGMPSTPEEVQVLPPNRRLHGSALPK
jgi:hypothetical protein